MMVNGTKIDLLTVRRIIDVYSRQYSVESERLYSPQEYLNDTMIAIYNIPYLSLSDKEQAMKVIEDLNTEIEMSIVESEKDEQSKSNSFNKAETTKKITESNREFKWAIFVISFSIFFVTIGYTLINSGSASISEILFSTFPDDVNAADALSLIVSLIAAIFALSITISIKEKQTSYFKDKVRGKKKRK